MKISLLSLSIIFGLWMAGAAMAQSTSLDPADEAAVLATKAAYYKQFPALPPSRNCLPEDAKGEWGQTKLLQFPGRDAAKQFGSEGPQYMVFGAHNLFVHKSSVRPPSSADLQAAMKDTQQQYIMSAKGMLYIYDRHTLKAPYVCWMVTQQTDEYPQGALLLAEPLVEGKPLILSIYTPLKAIMKPEGRNVR